MSIVGYARVSSTGQSLEIQEAALKDCDKIYCEKISAASHKKRPQLDAMMDWCRSGDTVVVTKLDRLARSMFDFTAIWKRLQDNGVNLVIQNMNIDTNTPHGKLNMNIVMSVAEFERELIAERRVEGIAAARAKGVKFGRPALSDENRELIVNLHLSGLSKLAIIEQTELSQATVYKVIREAIRDSKKAPEFELERQEELEPA